MFGGPLSDIPYCVSPGFSSIDAGLYVQASALHRRSPPLSAVLPSMGGRCAVAVAPLPRCLRLGPSWRWLRPPTRCSTLALYVSFCYLFYACPSLKCPVWLCYMDTWSDKCLGFFWNSSSHFPGLCRLVLTCSHDSLFLRYPAIDSVEWPCLPRFRIPETPCSLRLRLVVSKSWLVRYPVLPDVGSALSGLDTCRDSLQYSSCGIGSGINPLWGVCCCLVSAFLSLPHCIRFHRPVASIDEELCGWQVLSPPSHTGISMSDLRPCNPLARSLLSCLRFHQTVVPLGDVRCGLRLFLLSCRNPSSRW